MSCFACIIIDTREYGVLTILLKSFSEGDRLIQHFKAKRVGCAWHPPVPRSIAMRRWKGVPLNSLSFIGSREEVKHLRLHLVA